MIEIGHAQKRGFPGHGLRRRLTFAGINRISRKHPGALPQLRPRYQSPFAKILDAAGGYPPLLCRLFHVDVVHTAPSVTSFERSKLRFVRANYSCIYDSIISKKLQESVVRKQMSIYCRIFAVYVDVAPGNTSHPAMATCTFSPFLFFDSYGRIAQNT